jgi:SAM-dependent methyltransferase
MNRKARRAAQALGRNQPGSQPAIDPAIASLLYRGQGLRAGGYHQEALEIAKQAIRLKETDETRDFFVECVKDWSYFPGAEELRDVLARALREAWARSNVLLKITMGILARGPVFGVAVGRTAGAWPRRLSIDELVGSGGLIALARDPLLLALLESERVIGIEVEHFLTSLRAGLLAMAGEQHSRTDEDVVRLCCALAQQCCINDYVYDVTPDEIGTVSGLHDHVGKALAEKTAVAPMQLAILGAYFRLDALPARAVLKRSWPKGFSGLLDQQVHGPAAELRHRGSIPRLTQIADEISIKVREQYEENPYPRWNKMPAPARPMPVDQWFRQCFPMGNYRSMGKVSDVLVAGCGTGMHSIQFAQNYPDAKILAIDLSLASLCYAKEKTRAMGLNNIKYAQADILELGSLNRTFDIVSSGGVLHHLADMYSGWRTLLPLLRPDGCMHLGLYSEVARRELVGAQQWLAQHGFTGSIDQIRRGRQKLAAAAATHSSFKAVMDFADFYATGDCRDLLFHVQEHRCTIPQIAKFLDESNLEFLGFKTSDQIIHQFCTRFPRERGADLSAWHEFELNNPDTFKNMYEFWVQKRPAVAQQAEA